MVASCRAAAVIWRSGDGKYAGLNAPLIRKAVIEAQHAVLLLGRCIVLRPLQREPGLRLDQRHGGLVDADSEAVIWWNRRSHIGGEQAGLNRDGGVIDILKCAGTRGRQPYAVFIFSQAVGDLFADRPTTNFDSLGQPGGLDGWNRSIGGTRAGRSAKVAEFAVDFTCCSACSARQICAMRPPLLSGYSSCNMVNTSNAALPGKPLKFWRN